MRDDVESLRQRIALLERERNDLVRDRRALRTETALLHRRLNAAVEAAENASRAKTRFISTVGHDLRQPIQAAALYTGLLSYRIQDPSAHELLTLLQASIEGLHGMLNGLLDLSRLEAGVVEPVLAEFDPGTMMSRLAAEFGPQAAAKGIVLRHRSFPHPVCSDEQLLERMLRNLLSNAITHTVRGGILLACRRRGNMAEFQVWDSGPGIAREHRQAIFEEFRQCHNPERNSAHGFGLGLAIVARIARLLNLRVNLRSAVGRGSVFCVRVPLAASAAASPCQPAAKDPHPGSPPDDFRNRTVLFVEDDRAVRLGVTMLLETWGMNVVAARDRDELAELLEHIEDEPSAIISDFRLPGGCTGRAVVDMVGERWRVPSIIITGDTAPERLREARSAGNRLLHKPVKPDELARTLEELLRQ